MVVKAVVYPAYGSEWLTAAADCLATSITCSPSRRSMFVRRSAALEAAGLAVPGGVPVRAVDDAAPWLEGVEHENIAKETARTATSLNPPPS